MKTLQNNFTTLEQSKRLLELGMPAWTSDCFYEYSSGNLSEAWVYKLFVGESEAIKNNLFSFRNGYTIPCWSVGRLIEIYLICNEVIDNVTELHHSAIKVDIREFNIVEYLIRKLSNKVKKNKSFFSKLEE